MNYFEQFIASAFFLTFFLYVVLFSFYGVLGFRDFWHFKWPREATSWRTGRRVPHKSDENLDE